MRYNSCMSLVIMSYEKRAQPPQEWLLAKVLERLSAFDALPVRVASKGQRLRVGVPVESWKM